MIVVVDPDQERTMGHSQEPARQIGWFRRSRSTAEFLQPDMRRHAGRRGAQLGNDGTERRRIDSRKRLTRQQHLVRNVVYRDGMTH